MPLSTESLLRLEQDFEALNQRIARLATHLGYALVNEQSIEDAIHAVSHHIRAEQAPAHEMHLWHEFRGLLVLRYQIITRYCNELGAPLALQLVCYAEERLQAKGWAPGADGLDVQALKRLDATT